MLKKEFKRKDVNRARNLLMGKTGASTGTQVGYNKKNKDYKEGDVWTDKEGLNIELVCTFARTLCELIVNDVTNKYNIKQSNNLLSSIERLRNDGVISPWISSYMHGIRIMGNKSVHPPKKTPKYKPLKLETGDLASTLMGIRLLLEFWEKNI